MIFISFVFGALQQTAVLQINISNYNHRFGSQIQEFIVLIFFIYFFKLLLKLILHSVTILTLHGIA